MRKGLAAGRHGGAALPGGSSGTLRVEGPGSGLGGQRSAAAWCLPLSLVRVLPSAGRAGRWGSSALSRFGGSWRDWVMGGRSVRRGGAKAGSGWRARWRCGLGQQRVLWCQYRRGPGALGGGAAPPFRVWEGLAGPGQGRPVGVARRGASGRFEVGGTTAQRLGRQSVPWLGSAVGGARWAVGKLRLPAFGKVLMGTGSARAGR